MPPKARTIDQARVAALLAQGTPRREIARALGIPESTLRHHLKQSPPGGPPQGSQGRHPAPALDLIQGGPQGALDPPLDQDAAACVPHAEGPPRVSPGTPLSFAERTPAPDPDPGPAPAADSHSTAERTRSRQGPHAVDARPPLGEIMAAWPDLQAMLTWWQELHQGAQDAGEKLERVTYHVAPRWIAAVKREADRTRESYAAVVNRAFRQYFSQRET